MTNEPKTWEHGSIKRWETLKSENRFPLTRGVWIGSYSMPAEALGNSSLEALKQTLTDIIPPKECPFAVGDTSVVQGAVECSYVPAIGSKAEFWRASSDGEVFGVRAFPEDLATRTLGEVMHLSIRTPVVQAGAFLAHAARFARALTQGSAEKVLVRMQWRGLKGRRLSRWGCGGDSTLDEVYECDRQDVATCDDGPEPVRLVRLNLTGLVLQLTDHLYSAFQPQQGAATFQLDGAWVREQLMEWQEWLGK